MGARLNLAVNDLGDKELKNIVEPVHVFSLHWLDQEPAATGRLLPLEDEAA